MRKVLFNRLNHKVIGIGFIVLMMFVVWLTYAVFSNKFTDYDRVTLETSKIGLQMPARADVKYRGVIVGEVLNFEPTREGARITLGLYPDQAKSVPDDVTGSIVPKTLFGEKYVSLERPEGAALAPHIRAGAVIRRTAVSTEVEQVLSDLYPLLTAIEPEQLNYTLNALATALEGRGDQIKGGVRTLDDYLRRLNPQLDDIVGDLRRTAQVSDLYAQAMPQIATILRNTVKTGNTLKEKEVELQTLFSDVSAFSKTAKAFLAANQSNLIQVANLSAEQLRLFAHYAPEYPCLFGGLANLVPREDDIFRGHTLHIDAQLLPNQPRAWNGNDRPVNGEHFIKPHCGTLPNPPGNQQHPFNVIPNLNDGIEQPTGKGTRRAPVGGLPTSGSYAGTAAEADLLRALLAPVVGEDPADVDDLGVMLLAPLARGSVVSVE